MHRPNSKWKADEFYTESGCSTRVYAHSLWSAANCGRGERERVRLENNMTPAEAIGIDIMPVPDSDLASSCDKWITLIQNTAIYTAT